MLGKTKVFLRAGQIDVLDSQRAGVLDSAAKRIQLRLRTFIARRILHSSKLVQFLSKLTAEAILLELYMLRNKKLLLPF